MEMAGAGTLPLLGAPWLGSGRSRQGQTVQSSDLGARTQGGEGRARLPLRLPELGVDSLEQCVHRGRHQREEEMELQYCV
jgi:hypothetical protein